MSYIQDGFTRVGADPSSVSNDIENGKAHIRLIQEELNILQAKEEKDSLDLALIREKQANLKDLEEDVRRNTIRLQAVENLKNTK